MRSLLLIGLTLGLTSSCTRSKDPNTKLILDTSPLQQVGAQSTFPADQKLCFGVNVKGPGIYGPPPSSCHPQRGVWHGFIDSGMDIVLPVPNGVDRKVELYAYVADSGDNSPCPPWNESMDYSKVYLAGQSDQPLELSGGDKVVEITASYPGAGNDVKSQLNLATNCATQPGGPLPTIVNLAVVPLYGTNGSNWNDWVMADGTGRLDASGSVCTVGSPGYYSCIHGGDLRYVNVPDVASCAGVTAYDDLDSFKWECLDGSGNVKLYSQLKSERGLRNLVTESGWIPNRITVNTPTAIYQSPPAAWWTNTVTSLIDNSATAPQTLGTSGTIYVADGPRASKGYIFGADRIGLVVKGGMNLVQMGNCDTAAITVGSGSNFCLIQGDTRNFTWIEGDFNDPSPVANSSGLLFKNSNHNTIRQSSFNQFYTGMYFYNSQNNQVRHSATSNSGFMGLKFSNSANDNHVEYFRSSNETQSGIQLVTSSRNVMQHLSIHNNGSDGVSFVSAGENYLTAAVISGSNKGLSLSTAHQNTIGLVTIGNMSNQGVYINGNNNTLHNVLVGNIAAQGFAISTGSTNFLINTVSTHTTGAGYVVQNAGSADNRLQGYVGLGNNTQLCQLAGGAVVAGGVIDLTCTTTGTDGSSTYTGNNSSAVLWTGLNLSTSFVGNLLTDDFTNGSDSSGSANYATTLDWWGFDNNFRGWGRNSPAMTGPAQGRCNSGSCRIWDWQLTSSDTWLLNRSGALNGINSAFVKGGTCPVEVGGSVTTTDQKPTPNTYLTNAVEIIGDFVGDEDGLCESNEGCVYTPNVGAYQGHGEITGADYCAFQNGTVSNVYMMAHPLNGI